MAIGYIFKLQTNTTVTLRDRNMDNLLDDDNCFDINDLLKKQVTIINDEHALSQDNHQIQPLHWQHCQQPTARITYSGTYSRCRL